MKKPFVGRSQNLQVAGTPQNPPRHLIDFSMTFMFQGCSEYEVTLNISYTIFEDQVLSEDVNFAHSTPKSFCLLRNHSRFTLKRQSY